MLRLSHQTLLLRAHVRTRTLCALRSRYIGRLAPLDAVEFVTGVQSAISERGKWIEINNDLKVSVPETHFCSDVKAGEEINFCS